MRLKEEMKDFEFVDGGRKFFCSVEVPSQRGMAAWWWFRLETGGSTRYAPFEAAPTDTAQSVRTRILAYYAELIAIQARPPLQRPAWRKPERPAVTAESAAELPPLPPPT